MKFPSIFGKPEMPEEPQKPLNEAENSEILAKSAENKEKALKMLKGFESKINELGKQREELKKAVEQGEKKQIEKISKEVSVLLKSAKKMKNAIEGKSEDNEISAEYVFKNEDGTEKKEIIEINFEKEIASILDLYEKHSIDIPENFKEQMQNMWERNTDAIKEAIKEKGFNKVLFIPEKLPNIKELEEKMTEGYEKEKGNKTYWSVTPDSIIETKTESRIILVHNASDLTSQPELKRTLDKKYGGEKENGKDNKAEDFIKQGEALNLSEYLILQRDIFEKTGIHLDSKKTPDGYIYWTWLPGAKSGSRVVHSNFYPGGGRVVVAADGLDDSGGHLGCRLSRSFK